MSATYGATRPGSYGRPWFVLAGVAGFYFGGMHAYGQFHTWIHGLFELNHQKSVEIEIPAVYGYLWVFLCGLGWGGVAAVFLVWLGKPGQSRWRHWLLGIVLALFCAWSFHWVTLAGPGLVMPAYDIVDYHNVEECPDCLRTIRTLVESMMWLGFLLGAILARLVLKQWRDVAFMITMAVGFGIAFTGFEWLHLFRRTGDAATAYFWSFWEASVGMLGGAVLGTCFLLFNRPRDETARVTEITRLELIIGVLLPIMASTYYVVPFRVARAAQWLLGYDEKSLRPAMSYTTLLVIVPVGLYLLYRIARSRTFFAQRAARFAYSGGLFMTIYAGYFVSSYLPRFALIEHGFGIWATQTIYGVAFAVSVLMFFRLRSGATTQCPVDLEENRGG